MMQKKENSGAFMDIWERINLWVESYKKWIVFLFLSIYFISGILIHRDYGLWVDDANQKILGEQSFNYVFHGDISLLSSSEKEYGSAFVLTTTAISELIGLRSDEDIYLFQASGCICFVCYSGRSSFTC